MVSITIATIAHNFSIDMRTACFLRVLILQELRYQHLHPLRKPSRSRSNGRDAFVGSSLRVDLAFIAAKPATAAGDTAPQYQQTSHQHLHVG